MNLITQFDRPYLIDEHLEGIAILQSIISGECTKCPYYKQCTTDETFCLPPDSACTKRKKKLMEVQK